MSDLTFFECFAGVGGMSLGFELAGWRCVGHAEIEEFPRRVLRARWPDVPLYGDVTELHFERNPSQPNAPLVTLLSGGSPCQDISVAGKRRGMIEGSETRSSLFFEQVRLWEESGAPYFLWENVPGAFSSNNGRDFAAVLSSLVGSAIAVPADGWRSGGVAAGRTGVAAWRVLDAQYFGVPQRRRRVFVLCARAGGVDPAEVLSLGEGVRGDLAEGDETWEGVAGDAATGARGGGGEPDARRGDGDDRGERSDGLSDRGPGAIAFVNRGRGDGAQAECSELAPSLRTPGGGSSHIHVVPIQEIGKRMSGGPREGVGHGKPGDPMYTLQSGAEHGVIAFDTKGTDVHHAADIAPAMRAMNNNDSRGSGLESLSAPLRSGQRAQQGVVSGRPRRLLPVECERLQGWPEQHTNVPDAKGKPASDSARYKASGNGIAKDVPAWIAFRLRAAIERLEAGV